ncbi:hypothetical protein [Lactobacillus sp. ESL0677]|uniref:hypothetical protein n=1 Tax=Lactobacillus sp. ESL0677 TaxID=2983208 RepID=UPI0023FA2949|nr:hypothetical protein [Lactobacillus sp. ESL0677]WEV36860.1 hypothetical protein OZX76_08995 [Lactobacillus sp. ESL0677]
MTEQENNTKDTEQENDELKVVMPDADWSTMTQEEFAEQPDYLQVFTDFYISQFNQRDLEIMDRYDTNANMVDINHYLLDNIKFSRKELIRHVLQYHAANFQSLIDEIAKKDEVDPSKMTTYIDWDNWYEDRRSKIENSLS